MQLLVCLQGCHITHRDLQHCIWYVRPHILSPSALHPTPMQLSSTNHQASATITQSPAMLFVPRRITQRWTFLQKPDRSLSSLSYTDSTSSLSLVGEYCSGMEYICDHGNGRTHRKHIHHALGNFIT